MNIRSVRGEYSTLRSPRAQWAEWTMCPWLLWLLVLQRLTVFQLLPAVTRFQLKHQSVSVWNITCNLHFVCHVQSSFTVQENVHWRVLVLSRHNTPVLPSNSQWAETTAAVRKMCDHAARYKIEITSKFCAKCFAIISWYCQYNLCFRLDLHGVFGHRLVAKNKEMNKLIANCCFCYCCLL